MLTLSSVKRKLKHQADLKEILVTYTSRSIALKAGHENTAKTTVYNTNMHIYSAPLLKQNTVTSKSFVFAA